MYLPKTHKIAKEIYLEAAKGTSLEESMDEAAADRLAQMFTLVIEDQAERKAAASNKKEHTNEKAS